MLYLFVVLKIPILALGLDRLVGGAPDTDEPRTSPSGDGGTQGRARIRRGRCPRPPRRGPHGDAGCRCRPARACRHRLTGARRPARSSA